MSFKITPVQQAELLKAVNTLQQFVEGFEVAKNCKTCVYFIDNAGICEKYRQSPPPHIVESGCESWENCFDAPF